jgi:hypothetical protein
MVKNYTSDFNCLTVTNDSYYDYDTYRKKYVAIICLLMKLYFYHIPHLCLQNTVASFLILIFIVICMHAAINYFQNFVNLASVKSFYTFCQEHNNKICLCFNS